jgi:hypothetical protein
MVIQTPTRITIEIRPGEAEPGAAQPQPIVTVSPREEIEPPAAYEPSPCTCLDDEDCGADHGND